MQGLDKRLGLLRMSPGQVWFPNANLSPCGGSLLLSDAVSLLPFQLMAAEVAAPGALLECEFSLPLCCEKRRSRTVRE